MDPEIADRLVSINREFYQQFAVEFDGTRRRLQAGVENLLPRLIRSDRVLDLGCGNGNLWSALLRHGFQGEYAGLDGSRELVDIARRALEAGQRAVFKVRDLSQNNWADGVEGPFDTVTAFAVLHHLPAPFHEGILQQVHALLTPGGELLLSCWQFLRSPRWQQRILPWSEAGLEQDRLDPSDHLLDWRSGGRGLRYVHHFSDGELEALAALTGYEIAHTFSSDGREGNLALYQVWHPMS